MITIIIMYLSATGKTDIDLKNYGDYHDGINDCLKSFLFKYSHGSRVTM